LQEIYIQIEKIEYNFLDKCTIRRDIKKSNLRMPKVFLKTEFKKPIIPQNFIKITLRKIMQDIEK